MATYPSEQEFLQAFARALLAWQAIEECMYRIFASLASARDPLALSAAYHAVISLDARLDMIGAAANVRLAKGRKRKVMLAEWGPLAKKIRERSKRRNDLAHNGMVKDLDHAGRVSYVLGPGFVARYASGKERKTYSVGEINDFRASFVRLSSALDDFALRLFVILRPSPRKRAPRPN
jgi:hypothetical protein